MPTMTTGFVKNDIMLEIEKLEKILDIGVPPQTIAPLVANLIN